MILALPNHTELDTMAREDKPNTVYVLVSQCAQYSWKAISAIRIASSQFVEVSAV